MIDGPLLAALDACVPQGSQEVSDVARVRDLIGRGDPWSRNSPIHVTGSALVLDPSSARVLMRWHPRLHSWVQVGGHADEGEVDPWVVAFREANEETGIPNLSAWPPDQGRRPVQLTIVSVPAFGDEPAHEHADIRYLFATSSPGYAASEAPNAPVQWKTIDAAIDETDEQNLKEFLYRARNLLQLRE